ncbi:hypothetical protein B296_00049526 [Ensete ventricosum]|uniref:Uncharacterized protein n=1 Tax=Ensete ventricosum TaxID=4639 RepID=A0A426YQA0_ENSVE|nr:hypothetical protein B296_00049526 [Ensete ventricosum]
MKQRGLPSVIESQEQDLGLLLPQTKGGEDPVEPIYEKHSDRGGFGQGKRIRSIESRRDLAGIPPKRSDPGDGIGSESEIWDLNAERDQCAFDGTREETKWYPN